MTLPNANSINDCLIEFQANYSMKGGFSASMSLVCVPGSDLDTDLHWTAVNINLNSIEGTKDISAGSADLTGSTDWITGVVASDDVTEDENGQRIKKLSVVSYASGLSEKSLATETFTTTVGTVILNTLTQYLGYAASAYDIGTPNATYLNCMVQGSNGLQEIERLAAVGFADVFVQVGGKLTVSPWTDHGSSVDKVIPAEYVIKAERQRSSERPPSRIIIRGAQVSSYGAGWKVVSGGPGGDDAPTISRNKCQKPGADTPALKLPFKQLSAKDTDLKNASFLFDNHTFLNGYKPETNENEASASIENTSHTFLADAEESVAYKILTRESEPEVTSDPSTRLRASQAANRKLSGILGRASGVLGLVNNASFSADHGSESTDRNRLSMTVSDATLINAYGVISSQEDNPYIPDGLTAFYVGIRRLQEGRMGRYRYKLDTAYMPDLRLNHVVTFTMPIGGEVITGRITDISIRHVCETAATTMSITVEAFKSVKDATTTNFIGATTYTSDNLLKYPNAEGINSMDWYATDAYCISGYFGFDVNGILTQPLTVVTGLTYYLTADLTLLSASGGFKAIATTTSGFSASSTTYTATGTLSWNFTPTSSPISLSFQSTSGQWLMANPKLWVVVPNF